MNKAIRSKFTDNKYIMGLDVSMAEDYSYLTVIELETKTVLKTYNIRNDNNAVKLIERIREIVKEYPPREMAISSLGSAAAIVDHLRREGLPVFDLLIKPYTKAELYEQLKTALDSGEIKLVPSISPTQNLHYSLDMAYAWRVLKSIEAAELANKKEEESHE